jgi:predicted short-subunit dehydrogenase-like oxidoreductase (DUF2520 family)
MENRSVTILGSGNVAFHLGKALVQKGIRVDAVYSPNHNHAAALAEILNAKTISDIEQLPGTSNVYIIAVKDTAIEEVSNQLGKLHGLVVHTSGTTDMEVLWKHKRRGVFYPLQTISKHNDFSFEKVPFLVEATMSNDVEELWQLARHLGADAFVVNSEQRKIVHVAAVFANNFSNHLYTIAQHILTQHNLSFDMLKPLIRQTAHAIEHHAPKDLQTGPAARGDLGTIEQHLKLLQDMPEYAQVYALLSESIVQAKQEK